MVALTPQRKAELRAEKAIREGNTAFKPRGAANRAAFNVMKREFEKQTEQINSHTSSETTRVIGELGGQTERMNTEIQAKIVKSNKELKEEIESLKKNVTIGMRKIEGSQEQWIIKLTSLTVANLNNLLTTHGLPKKGTKAQKAVILSRLHPTVLQNFMDEQVSQSRPREHIAEAGTGDSEPPAKRAKHSSSSSSSSYSSSSSDSEKEEEEEEAEEKEQDHSKDGHCANDARPDPVAKWKLSYANRPNWQISLSHNQIYDFEQELAKTLAGLEPCTESEAQISLAPIVKRCARGHSVILVELPKKQEEAAPEGLKDKAHVNHSEAIAAEALAPDKDKDKESDYTYTDSEGEDGEEKKPTMEAQQAADNRREAKREKEIEANVDCLMHQIDAQKSAKKLKMLAESADHPHPFQESFDKRAQQEAAKEGFVPGVLVFLNGNSKQKWHIDKIYCDWGDTCADISTTPHESGVVRHARCHISQLTLAEPVHGPVIEQIAED
jgi:hypothetical protein